MGDSDFLFSTPSFLTGAGRTLDLFGNMTGYNDSSTPEEADMRALMRDGLAIRKDLSAAMMLYENSNK